MPPSPRPTPLRPLRRPRPNCGELLAAEHACAREDWAQALTAMQPLVERGQVDLVGALLLARAAEGVGQEEAAERWSRTATELLVELEACLDSGPRRRAPR